MTALNEALRDDVRMMGNRLGQAIENQLGRGMLQKIETIRGLAKLGRSSDSNKQSELLTVLAALSDDEVLPIARAFTQFLNLANIAEEYHRVRTEQHVCDIDSNDSFVQQLKLLRNDNHNADTIMHALRGLRNLGQKPLQRERIDELISQIWHTNEIRGHRAGRSDTLQVRHPGNSGPQSGTLYRRRADSHAALSAG